MMVYIDMDCDTCKTALEIKCNKGWGCASYGKQFCFVCGHDTKIGTCDCLSKYLPSEDSCNGYQQKDVNTTPSLTLCVDRIEEGWLAVERPGKGTFDLPPEFGEGVCEGDRIRITVERMVDNETTTKNRATYSL